MWEESEGGGGGGNVGGGGRCAGCSFAFWEPSATSGFSMSI